MTRARDLADGADKDITGTLTLDDIVLSNDMSVADDGKVQFGAGNDLQIYHDGLKSVIEDVGTGDLVVRAGNLYINNAAGTENMVHAVNNGAVTLYHDNAAKLATTSSGIDVTGGIVVDQESGGQGISFQRSGYDTMDIELSESGFRIRNETDSRTDFFINGSGNVGIGVSSPGRFVHLEDGTDTTLHLTTSSTGSTGSDGTSLFVDGTAASLWQRENDYLRFATNNAERMRIDSSGRVLINATTANTSSKFIVAGGAARTSSGSLTDEGMVLMPSANLSTGQYTPWLAFTPQTSTPSRARAGIGAVSTNGTGALDMVFATRSAADGSEATGADEKMRLNSAGELIIGASTFNTSENSKQITGGTIDCMRNTTSGVNQLTFQNPNGVVGSISTSGTSTSFSTSSDHRLKEAVVDMTGAITRVKSLAPKRFNFIADDSVTVDGFLAHEAQAVVPEAVTGTHNEVDDDGNAVMQGIDQSKLVPLLTAALQEAIAKIETLETKVAALEAE